MSSLCNGELLQNCGLSHTVSPNPLLENCALQDEDQVCIVTELCLGGDLEHFLKVSVQFCVRGGDRGACQIPAWAAHKHVESWLAFQLQKAFV